MCRTLSVNRADFYRWLRKAGTGNGELELRDQIQRIAPGMPAYGYRRITHELRRRGIVFNHKRVLRLMRLDNLLSRRKKRFVRTTDSRHDLGVYPNLVPELFVTAWISCGWRTLLTFRLRGEFVFLAVILDAFSRRCIGWALDRTPQNAGGSDPDCLAHGFRGPTSALWPGPSFSPPAGGSDRGAQYASDAYTNRLKQYGMRISMSRKGNPDDNPAIGGITLRPRISSRR